MKKLFLFMLLLIHLMSNGRCVEPTEIARYNSLFLCDAGTVYSTGSNLGGELGNGSPTGTNARSLVPVQVSGLTNVIAVATGNIHELALKSDGTVWAWGSNGSGALGDNSTTMRTTPVQVHGPGNVGFLTGIIAISAGYSYSLALKNDGTVWAWGSNDYGKLGINNTVAINQLTPVQITTLSGITAISAGALSAMALKNDGTLWSWGDNTSGILGDNTTITKYAPVQVHGVNDVGFLTGIAGIAMGYGHAVALASNGIVYSCGGNVGGCLGDGSNIGFSATFIQSVIVPSGMIAVSAGAEFTLALRNDGTIWGWGTNGYSELGNGTTNGGAVTAATQVSGLTGVNSIFTGQDHAGAVKNDGTVWTWGRNSEGQLGDGTQVQRSIPVKITLPCPAKVNPPVCNLLSIDKATTDGQNASVVLSTLPGYPVITGKNISITGTLNIDQNITFAGCNIKMAANAKINLTGGNLTITNKTHLYSCTGMWDGIYVPAGRKITINGDAFIEDALNAVVSTGGAPFDINTAIFNKNLIALDVRTYKSTHPGTMANTVITSRDIPALANTASNPTVAALKAGATLTSFTPTVLKIPYNDRKGLLWFKCKRCGKHYYRFLRCNCFKFI